MTIDEKIQILKSEIGTLKRRLERKEKELQDLIEEAQATQQPHPCSECKKYGCDVHCPYYGK